MCTLIASCQLRAVFMAEKGRACFFPTKQLRTHIELNLWAGETVQRGPNVETMHEDSMSSGQ